MTTNTNYVFIEGTEATSALASAPSKTTTMTENTNFESLVERPVLLTHIDWDSATTGIELRLMEDALTQLETSTLLQYINLMAYNRLDLKIVVKVNGTPFHKGCLLLSYQPGLYPNADWPRGSELSYWTSLQHLKISANGSSSATMSIPFQIPASYLLQQDLFKSYFGSLILYPMNPLVVSAGASSSISLNIWLHFPRVEARGYTPFQLPSTMHGPPPSYFKKGSIENRSNSTSQSCAPAPCTCQSLQGPPTPAPAVAHAQGAAASSSNPIASVLGAVGSVGDTVGSVMESLGPVLEMAGMFLDKPTQEGESQKFTRKTASSWINGVGSSNATTLSLAPGLVSPLLPQDTLPELVTTKALITRPCLLAQTEITTDLLENALIAAYPVVPTWNPGSTATGPGGQYSNMTPLTFVAAAYQWWRGSINYKFQFVTSAFTQFTLAFVHIPDETSLTGPTGGYTTNASKVQAEIVEVQGAMEHSISIPFLSRQPMKQVPPMLTDRYNIHPNLATSDSAMQQSDLLTEHWNGVLYVYLVNRLVVTNNVPPAVTMNTWVSGGEDMDFAYPSTFSAVAIPNTFLDITPVSPVAAPTTFRRPAFIRQNAEVENFSAVQAEEPVEQEQKNAVGALPSAPITTQPPFTLSKVLGEDYNDIYKIMKRLYHVHHFQGTTSMTSSDFGLRTYIIPVTPQLIGNIRPNTKTGSYPDKYNILTTPLTYWSKSAFYWSGSLEYRIAVSDESAVTHAHSLRASFLPASSWTNGSFAPPLNYFPDKLNLGDQTCLASYTTPAPTRVDLSPAVLGFELEQVWQQGVLSVRVPFFNHRPYLPLNPNNYLGEASSGEIQFQYPLSTVTGWLIVQNTCNNRTASSPLAPSLDIYIGGGDDFKLLLTAPPGIVYYDAS